MTVWHPGVDMSCISIHLLVAMVRVQVQFILRHRIMMTVRV